MVKLDNSTTMVIVAVISMVLIFAAAPHAFAHANFEFKPGTNTNNTIRVVIGQTHEPSFTDEEHNLEMTVTHKLTSIPVANLGKSQASTTTNILFVDTYFYPKSALNATTGAVPKLTGCSVSASVNPANCAPGVGYTDSRATGSAISAISTAFPDSGAPGQYRQSTRQYYTEDGRTLYHIYGKMNIFNDTAVGPIPVNIWTDGSTVQTNNQYNIARISVCESMVSPTGVIPNTSTCITGGSGNTTKSFSGSFSMENISSIYWPDADGGVTENTHPTNIRKAIGTTRDNTFDNWNVLEKIANAINSIPGIGTLVPDYQPRNSTNTAPTGYTFP